MMSGDVYKRLREQLNHYSVGFPSTKSGVEMKILEKLFTEEEARMFLNLSMMLETAESVAQRTKQDLHEVTKILEGMAEKGLIFRLRKDGTVRYGAEPFVIGFYEFQLKTMDRELAQLVEKYFEEGFEDQTVDQILPLRTVPVNEALDVSWSVAPYEDLRKIIRSKDRIAVARCICRVQQGLLEKACDKPLEVCFAFGSHAEYYVDRQMGRWVSQGEAIEILERCDEAGLVPQPLNTQDPAGMCNCCGDCCGMLRALRKHPRPAQMVISNYYAIVDPALCAACETCLERCQMDAITIGSGDAAQVDLERCVGCGLCITTCETEALSLVPKTGEERRDPPETARDLMTSTAQQRGKSLIPLAFTEAAGSGS